MMSLLVPFKMDVTRENQRFYVFTRLQLGDELKKIHSDLFIVYADLAVPYNTCSRWVREFKDGRKEFSDKPRPGAPKSKVNEELIANVKNQVDNDPNVSVREISSDLDVSIGTVHKVLHEELGLRKISARWVPHILTAEQKRRRFNCAKQLLDMFEPNGPKRISDIVTGDETWIYLYGIPNKRSNMMWLTKDDPRPLVCKPGFQSRKRLFTIFFNHEGPVTVDILPEKSTMTGKYYCENVLPQVVSKVNESRPLTGTSRIMILHDNASAHKTGAVTQYLSENRIATLPHPAYSPDLAPCDFWLFPKLKELLAGNKYTRAQDLSKAVNAVLRGIPKEEYSTAFHKWQRRLQMCVERGGEYFEGL